ENLRIEIIPESCVQQIDLTRKRHYATALTAHEWKLIREVQTAMEVFEDERTLPIVGEFTSFMQSYNWSQVYSGRVSSFCQNMSPFNVLNHQDQLILLKAFYFELLNFRFFYMTDEKQDGFLVLAVGLYCKLFLESAT